MRIMAKGEDFQELRNLMFVRRHSQCIYRTIQSFFDPWYFIMHGIYLWFLIHSHFRVFLSFLERVGITHNKCSTSLDLLGEGIIMFWTIFGGILVVKVQMEEIMVGILCIIMVWTIES